MNISQADICARFIEYKDEILQLFKVKDKNFDNTSTIESCKVDLNAINQLITKRITQKESENSKISPKEFEYFKHTLDKVVLELNSKLQI